MSGARPWLKHYPPKASELNSAGLPARESADELVRRAATTFRDRAAVSTALPNGWTASLTYEDLEQKSAAFARFLREDLDLKSGDVVALQSLNCASFAVAILGILRAGLIVTNVNPLYTPYEMRHQLHDSGAKAIVFMDVLGETVEKALDGQTDVKLVSMSLSDFFESSKRSELLNSMKLADSKTPNIVSKSEGFMEALRKGRQSMTPIASYGSNPDDPSSAIYQYSGGTTGRSKGVILDFDRVIGNHLQTRSMMDDTVDPPETTLLVLPVYHMFGLTMLLYSLNVGGHTVMASDPRPVSKLRTLFEAFQPDWVPGVNTLLAHLLEEDWFAANPPQIKTTISGGTALMRDVADRWTETTGATIVEGYGMTESTAMLTLSVPGYTYKPGSVGTPAPMTDIVILNDDNTFADTGIAGEIVAKGPQVMEGYLNAPDLNENAFFEGWLRTGDMGYLDEDGFLYLVDRKKDMILVSGFNVFPAEIENCLCDHPDILEACVVGIPHDGTGEKVIAHVVASSEELSTDEISRHCAERLTNYKRPRRIEIVNELPKTPVGKILRREVREIAEKQEQSSDS